MFGEQSNKAVSLPLGDRDYFIDGDKKLKSAITEILSDLFCK